MTTRGMPNDNRCGLTTTEAQGRLKQFGPNAVPEEKTHPLRAFLRRFWAPIRWLLEATIIIQLFLGEDLEAAVIGGLLVLNATLSLVQEGRAQKALTLLRQQLRVFAHVRRDGAWSTMSAEELVPGDVIHLRQGTIVPADAKLEVGSLLVDQSALTGESAAASAESGNTVYAGSMVRGGDATGEVTATGARTFFGKTAEVVRTAGSVNRQEHEIVGVVKNLFVANAAMVVVVVVREDSKSVVGTIRDAGVRTVMITGDNALTAHSVAEQVGIPGDVCSPEKLHGDLGGDSLDCGIFAGVFPEDKFRLVRGFQCSRQLDIERDLDQGVSAPLCRFQTVGHGNPNAILAELQPRRQCWPRTRKPGYHQRSHQEEGPGHCGPRSANRLGNGHSRQGIDASY
jgi:magnesium-transporting ATPase (P-type)